MTCSAKRAAHTTVNGEIRLLPLGVSGAGDYAYTLICTRDRGHEGEHIAHGTDLRVVATWPQDEPLTEKQRDAQAAPADSSGEGPESRASDEGAKRLDASSSCRDAGDSRKPRTLRFEADRTDGTVCSFCNRCLSTAHSTAKDARGVRVYNAAHGPRFGGDARVGTTFTREGDKGAVEELAEDTRPFYAVCGSCIGAMVQAIEVGK